MPKLSAFSNKKKLLIALAIVAAVAVIYILIRKGESVKKGEKDAASFSSTAPSDFHGIRPEGIGGDPDLNRDKNRWVAPAELTTMTVAQIIALPHDELSTMGKKDRSKWTTAAAAQASESENHGVQAVGYLAHAKESGAEACNGKSDFYHDFHLWLTDIPGVDKREGVVIEVTPFWKEQFPAWELRSFEKMVTERTKVRVTGWILWDEEHGDEVGKSRGSLWEIHPITKFEYFSEGKWEELGSGVIP